MAVAFSDIQAAAEAIAGHVVRTPMRPSPSISALTGAEVWLKLENLQFTASFKDRGALYRIQALTELERSLGVIAISAGNHAQGVAYHAGRLGIPATIAMPKGTPFAKVARTESFGARVIQEGNDIADLEALAADLVAKEGLTLIHPYDDERIIAGQGTVGLEMLDSAPDLDMIVAPIGGGGLMAGIAVAAKAIKPDIRLIGVEAAAFPSMACALAGTPAPPGKPTIAEGIAVKHPGKRTLPIIRDHVEDIIVLNEAELEYGVQELATVGKVVAEGAGAAPLAALLTKPEAFRGLKVGLVISGGNIDATMLASCLMRSLVRHKRLVRLRVEVSDAPGGLAQATRIIAEAGANVLEVEHNRLFFDVPIKLTEIDFVLEVRDAAHGDRLLAALAKEGVSARILDPHAHGVPTV
ncbi:MAG: threonine ammonia-lyase [Alphaproteobacteria bacterium]|nr:threonine ammonia-lyase [Alphaproteobacteria bacterium]MCB9930642.1 threonine ammonia-lyase [Alphaproteobacteria bacterium]